MMSSINLYGVILLVGVALVHSKAISDLGAKVSTAQIHNVIKFRGLQNSTFSTKVNVCELFEYLSSVNVNITQSSDKV